MVCTCQPEVRICSCGAESEHEAELESKESGSEHERKCMSTGCIRCANLQRKRIH